jgi:ABC-2 type transport system ATP-binding protein
MEAVAGVDLAVRSGEIYGFLGPNGAGKSTTLMMLCTLLLPSGGEARVAGYDVVQSSDAVRLRIGVALQDVAVDPKLTGREMLVLQGRYYGLRRAEIARRLDEVLDLIAIGDAIDRLCGTYSGGMRRRLDLAAALVHNPEVLFLDEPTTGLDPVSRMRVWDEVRFLNRQLGVTVLLTTQYLEEADQLADRVGVIQAGRIIAEGTAVDLKRRVGDDVVTIQVASEGAGAHGGAPSSVRAAIERALGSLPGVRVAVRGTEVTVTTPNGGAMLSPIAVMLHEHDVRVLDMSLRMPTLDDVFLQLTGEHAAEESGDPDPLQPKVPV